MSDHIGDDAALYALGLLDEAERAAVDAHVDRCEACQRLLSQAFDDVALAVEAEAQIEPAHAQKARSRDARAFAALSALAAAVVIALLPAGYLYEQNRSMHVAMLAESQAMARIASAPHRTALFAGARAEVMYGPDGSWYCVVIHGAKAAVDVTWMHDGEQTMLGRAVPHGDVAILYLPKSHRMDQLALVAENRMMGQARLVF